MQNIDGVTDKNPIEEAPSLLKLGACLMYESLVIIAIYLASTAAFLGLFGDATHGYKRYLLQLVLWLTVGTYFVWCWQKTGQTLAMQTWKLKLVRQNPEQDLLSVKLSVLRYILVSASLLLFGIGFLWILVDRNKLFLHDRLLMTYIIKR